MENFQGDRAVVPEIVGEKYGRHAPTPKLALDAVAISQPCLEPFGEICHSNLARGSIEEAQKHRDWLVGRVARD